MAAALESFTSCTFDEGETPDGPEEVANIRRFGDSAVELTYKTLATGLVGTRLLYRDDEPRLEAFKRGFFGPLMGMTTSSVSSPRSNASG